MTALNPKVSPSSGTTSQSRAASPVRRRILVHQRRASDSAFKYSNRIQEIAQRASVEAPNSNPPPPSRPLFNQINGLIRNKDVEQAWTLWENNSQEKPQTRKEYYRLLNLFVKKDKPNEALDLWQQMQHDHKPKNIIQYQILIDFFIQTNQVEEVMQVWEKMQTKPIEHYSIIYHKVLDFAANSQHKPASLARIAFYQIYLFIQQNKVIQAFSFWESMQTKRIYPSDVRDYNILFILFAATGEWLHILAFWGQMQEKRIRPDQDTISLLNQIQEALWFEAEGKDIPSAASLFEILEKPQEIH